MKNWIKDHLKTLAFRCMRPGLSDLDARVERIEGQMETLTGRVRNITWRGSFSNPGVGGGIHDLAPIADVMRKYRSELGFWIDLIRDEEKSTKLIGSPFHPAAVYWSSLKRPRLIEALGLKHESELDAWTGQRTLVEIGSGPHPFLSDLHCRRAIAVDPLMDGYAREGLLPPEDHRTVFLASTGESMPLPGGSADLVVIENCLDHVDDPSAVMSEIRRVLRDDGLMWLLVDLSKRTDEMHPHAFDEDVARRLMTSHGFRIVHEKVSDHSSHPDAYGEYRALAARESSEPGVPS